MSDHSTASGGTSRWLRGQTPSCGNSTHALLRQVLLLLSCAARVKDGFEKDEMARKCEEAQREPFLRTGVAPRVDMHMYLQVRAVRRLMGVGVFCAALCCARTV